MAMARNNQRSSNQRGSNNNNNEGRNQYSGGYRPLPQRPQQSAQASSCGPAEARSANS
jgi:hypothetical protein